MTVPDGWNPTRLKDCLDVLRRTVSTDDLAAHESVFLYSIPAFDEGDGPVATEGSDIGSTKYNVPSDCVLFSRLNPRIPRVWRVTHGGGSPAVASTEFWPITADEGRVTHEYLAAFLGSPTFLNHPTIRPASSTNSHQRVRLRDFLRYRAAFPPLPEQKKIAAILSSVDDAIAASRAVIEQTKKVKKGLLQDLLRKGIGHTRFKQTPIGQVPKSWEVVPIEAVGDVRGGKRLPKGTPYADHETPWPYIRVSDFVDGSVRMTDLRYVDEATFEAIKRYTISSDDVYISIAGTLGVPGTVPSTLDGALLTENAAKIVIDDTTRLSNDFLSLALQSAIGQRQILMRRGIGAGVPKLALYRISSLLVPIPSRREQDEIVGAVGGVESLTAQAIDSTQQLGEIKSGLLQDLLSGKVRVTP